MKSRFYELIYSIQYNCSHNQWKLEFCRNHFKTFINLLFIKFYNTFIYNYDESVKFKINKKFKYILFTQYVGFFIIKQLLRCNVADNYLIYRIC